MDANQLLVDELLNAHVAQFATVPGVLDATELNRPGFAGDFQPD